MRSLSIFNSVWILLAVVKLADACSNYGQCIYGNISANYMQQVRPMRHANDTLIVYVKLVVLSLSAITEVTETMDIMGYFRVTWTDHRLTWDPEKYDGITQIVIPASEIWLPDMVLYNSASNFYDESYKRDFWVQLNYTGSIFWGFGGKISTSCDIGMHDYPFDSQGCDIILESWAYTNDQLDYAFQEDGEGGLSVNESARSHQVWTYQGAKTRSILKYGNRYRRLVFTLEWTRKRLYYHTNIVIPVSLLSLITLGVFWIPVESGDKVSLAITLMLAFSVFQIVIMDNTPVNSNVVPRITQYVLLVTCLATASLLTSMFVVYINGQVTAKRPPRKMRMFLFRYVAKFLCVSHDSDLDIDKDLEITDTYVELSEKKKCFNNEQTTAEGTDANQNSSSDDVSAKVLEKILENLNEIKDHFEEDSQTEVIKQEWAFIGRIVDRVLFWITFIIYIIFVIYIFNEK